MSNSQFKPKIGISTGDINGIGPEVMIKTLNDPALLTKCTPVIYGPSMVFSAYQERIKCPNFSFQVISTIENLEEGEINLIESYAGNFELNIGEITEKAGEIAFNCLENVMKDLNANKIDALVTAPINKQNIQREEFPYAGHTDYITHKVGANESLMMMVSDELKVALATTHIPLSEVSNCITKELLSKKIQILKKSLIKDFNIDQPKIAVLGLDPHAGDNGVIGNLDKTIVSPFIEELKANGELIFGPFPTDGFFGTHQYKSFDAVFGMYHDQVLTPFKLLHFDDGVNYTAGLPIVRTSPDHGTAYDIAGKGIANTNSFKSALHLAIDIAKNRNPLI